MQKMMSKNDERRAVQDRRNDDKGPPAGWTERRRSTERRLPALNELEISESEWQMYFGAKPDESTALAHAIRETTAETSSRVHD